MTSLTLTVKYTGYIGVDHPPNYGSRRTDFYIIITDFRDHVKAGIGEDNIFSVTYASGK